MKTYIKSSSDSEHLEEVKELLTEIGDITTEGYKLADKLNKLSETNLEADISGQLKYLFSEAGDFVDDLTSELFY